ncbi:MAG: ATP-binding protein, partial [Rhodospirillaceae bacterium]|nr:ATP-binding protein [Rhodospirillaceae bacterium]
VAHDFNNLLTVILGNAEACRAEMALNRQAREHLDLILLAGQKGADLTQRLLSFARQQQLSPRSFDLNGRVREFVKLVSRTVEENIEIGVSLSDGLEPVRADPGELDTALLNLVVNARHAMTQGGKITIETGRAAFDENTASQEPGVMPGHYATVAVSDTGIGMSEDVVRRAFEPFFTTKPQGKGSGLGLSMVFGFAKQSGGHAEIKSAVGRGTTVRLYLPFASTRDKFEADTSEAEAAAPRGGRILVVEDNDFVRQTVTFQLERLGYTVTGAPTAAAALDILRQDAGLDLVLSDMVMPGGLSGADLLREVTEHYPGIKVVLMSGYAGAELRDQIRSIGDAPLLQKPVSSKVLARAIEHVLSA